MKRTKTKLISSIVTLLVCFAMLVGSTFAWFTDSASTGVNRIQAGNLDIKVEYLSDLANNTWTEVDVNKKLFNDNALWEPGYAEVAYLKITNAGNLHLKYKLSVNVNNEVTGTSVNGTEIKLSEILKFGKVISNSLTTYSKDSTGREQAISAVSGNETSLTAYSNENLDLVPGASEYVTLVVYMPSTVGNEANYRGETVPSIKLGLDVVATQTSYENDSFDNQYDKDSLYPILAPVMNSTVSVSYSTVPTNDITITGDKATTTVPSNTSMTGVTLTENGKLERVLNTTASTADSVTYDIGFKYIVGEVSNPVHEFSEVLKTTITLSTGLKDVVVTHAGTPMSTENPGEDQTYQYIPSTGVLTIWSSTYSKYEISYKTDHEVAVDGQGMTLASFRDSVNAGNAYTGKVVTLVNNVSLTGTDWTPIGTQDRPFSGTIKGNNKEISGLNNCLIKYATGNINIDDLNIEINFNDDTADFVGGLIGVYDTNNSTNINAEVLINNVDATGSIIAKDKAGGIIGSTYNSSVGNGNDIDFKLIDCTNSATVTAKRAGGLIGTSAAYLKGDKGNNNFKITIDGCENTAAISSPTDSSNYRAGGFIGYCGGYGNYVFNSIKNSGTDCLIGISRIGSTPRVVNNQGLIKDECASVLATDDYDYYYGSVAEDITMRLWKWHGLLEQTQGSKDSSYKYVNLDSMLKNDEWRFTIDGKHYKFASSAVHIRGVEDGVEQTSHVAINSDPNTYAIDGISVEYVENKSMNISGTVQNWTGWMAKIGEGTYNFDPKDYIPHNERPNYTITENENGTWTVVEKTAKSGS